MRIRAPKKGKKSDEEVTYWLSFSDLMSSLLIIFLLLFVYKILDYNQEIKSYSQALSSKEAKIQELSSVRKKIIIRLLEEFSEDIKIDQNTGAVKLRSEVLFDNNKSELKPAGKVFLSKFMPKYLNVLLGDKEIKDSLSRVIIEGHTDDIGEYIYNLELSQDRALNVVKYILNDPVNKKYRGDIEKYVSAIGRSKSDLIKNGNNVLKSESRRVEFKFQLKDEETIKAILDEIKSSEDKKVVTHEN
ncbi:OmpA family protein [Clostridium sp.]